MKNLCIYVLVLFPVLVIGQTTTENYIKSTIYQVATTDGNVSEDQKIETITYYDGLERPKQSIAQRAGGNREDLVTPVEYDALGRQPREYLPYPVLNNQGDYHTNVLPTLTSYYYNNFENDRQSSPQINPYSEKRFENSPLNRVLEQGAPGMDWKINPATDTDHTIKHEYKTNTHNEVVHFSVNLSGNTPSLISLGNYPANQLIKKGIKDENWQPANEASNITYEFTNKQGQVVLKRNAITQTNGGQQDLTYYDTYYIYDDYGNLTYVLSPESVEQIVYSDGSLITGYQTILGDLCYQYKYDYRNRLVEKKLPGKGWEYIVYDKLDRPILTQDQNLKSENTWLFTKYDAFGRVAYTGTFGGVGTRESFQNLVNGLTVFYEQRTTTPTTVGDITLYYTANQAYPFSPLEVLTVNYYDDYIDTMTDMGAMNLPASVYGVTVSNATKGLPTVSRVRVLDDTTNDWIIFLTGYDDKGQVIYTRSVNEYLDTNDVVMSQLDFTGKPLETTTIHSKTGHDAITTKDYFTYDHMGRLATHMQRIDDAPTQLIAHNQYDELGQLISKKVGGELYETGYTAIDDVAIGADGLIYKTTSTHNWDAALATKGVLEHDGGVSFSVPQQGYIMQVGLNDENVHSGTGGMDYYIRFRFSNGQSYFRCYARNGAGQVVEILPNNSYASGDTFAVERQGDQINYIHNGTVVIGYQLQVSFPSFVGDTSFYSPNAGIKDLELYAIDINKSLQTVDYKYNIRGWLTDINDVAGKQKRIDLFNFRINYNRIDGSTTGTPLYNGNIAQTLWKTDNEDKNIRSYNYSYDVLNRITDANGYKGLKINSMTAYRNHNVEAIEYDRNGNIFSLIRNGSNDDETAYGIWDNLTYYYAANRLQEVEDNAPLPAYKDMGFKDGASIGNDYYYDANGNMTIDKNKGIVKITYNHLNLPEKITINNGSQSGTITYVYDATGVKLKKTLVSGTNPTVHTEYAGNYVYSNMESVGSLQLQFFNHPEGYIEPVINNTTKSVKGYDAGSGEITYSAFKYVFQYKDHLGNIRLSYSDNDLNGTINPATEIIEESNYYPFGLKQNGYNTTITGSGNALAQNWDYQGKESQEELGFNWHDFGARNYDASIGRWLSIDPLSEEFFEWSPYTAMNDNPINYIDPTGMGAEWVPTVSESGEISYVAEKGDSASTMSSQFGISQEKAEAITGTMGDTQIEEGTAVSGKTVAENNNGNQILKLDLTSPEGMSQQRRFDQFVFANDVTKAYGGTEFHPADFYTNRFEASVTSLGGLGSIDGTATLNVGGISLVLEYQLELYSSNPYADRNGFAIDTEANDFGGTTGNRFPGNTGILKYNRITPTGKSVRSGNRLLIQNNQSEKYMKRLNRTFDIDRSKADFKN